MSPSEATNEATRREWRELGFFYDVDGSSRRWRLVGSRSGLSSFVRLLHRYCADPRNDFQSEHEHYGPYMYLKIMTWPDAGIDGNSIRGSLDDLTRLARLVEQQLHTALAGETICLGKSYASSSEYDLVLEVKDEGFDPADADPCLR